MKKTTKRIYNNCYFGILYLWMRGRLARVACVDTMSWIVPYHFVALNRSGNAIHFNHEDNREHNSVVPFWFYGSYVGVSKSKQKELLVYHNRRVVRTIPGDLFAMFAIMFLLMMAPYWCLMWAIYTPYIILRDIIDIGVG
jgi:hypothetical protein